MFVSFLEKITIDLEVMWLPNENKHICHCYHSKRGWPLRMRFEKIMRPGKFLNRVFELKKMEKNVFKFRHLLAALLSCPCCSLINDYVTRGRKGQWIISSVLYPEVTTNQPEVTNYKGVFAVVRAVCACSLQNKKSIYIYIKVSFLKVAASTMSVWQSFSIWSWT